MDIFLLLFPARRQESHLDRGMDHSSGDKLNRLSQPMVDFIQSMCDEILSYNRGLSMPSFEQAILQLPIPASAHLRPFVCRHSIGLPANSSSLKISLNSEREASLLVLLINFAHYCLENIIYKLIFIE